MAAKRCVRTDAADAQILSGRKGLRGGEHLRYGLAEELVEARGVVGDVADGFLAELQYWVVVVAAGMLNEQQGRETRCEEFCWRLTMSA